MEDWKLNTTYVSQITKVQTEFEHTRKFQKDLRDWVMVSFLKEKSEHGW